MGKGVESGFRSGAVWRIAGAALFLAVCASAAQPAKVLIIKSSELGAFDEAIAGFRAAFAPKGRPFSLVVKTLPDEPSAVQAFLGSLEGEKPTVILAVGTRAARLARSRVAFAPVVYCMALESNQELAYGGATLEVSLTERVTRSLECLTGARKVGLIYNSARFSAPTEEMNALEKKGLLVVTPASTVSEVDRAVDILHGRADCLLLTPDPEIFPPQMLGPFFQQAIGKGLPLVGLSPAQVRAGAVVAFFADFRNNGERAAELVSKVLGGENPKDLPILSPSKINSSFNLAVARHINRSVSPTAVKGAVEVIK